MDVRTHRRGDTVNAGLSEDGDLSGAGGRQTGDGSIFLPSQATQLCRVDPSFVKTAGAIRSALCCLSICC